MFRDLRPLSYRFDASLGGPEAEESATRPGQRLSLRRVQELVLFRNVATAV